jgi:general secretion pathway protein D
MLIVALVPLVVSGQAAAPPASDRGIALAPNAPIPESASAPRGPTLLPGSGVFASPPAAATTAADSEGGNGFQLSFTDTAISAVVGSVLGEGLNVPYVVDPQVKGNMSLQATRPLSREETLAALEAALSVQGVAMVEVRGVWNIVPLKDAPRRVSTLRLAGVSSVGFGITIVPLQYVSATEMEKILQPFAPQGGILRVDNARNMLLLAGAGQELTTMLDVVNTFDVDWLAGMSFALYPLEYVDAPAIATELEQIFNGAGNPIGGVVRIVPLARLNALMIVTAQSRYLDQVQNWIRRLDVAAATPGRRIYVYDIQNGKADELASSLSSILSIDLGTTTASADAATTGASAGATRAAASAVRSSSSNDGSGTSEVKIVSNAENNSLLILATPSEYGVIEAALKRLDVVPIQVLIEASIAEVTLTDNLRYGLQWAYQSDRGPIVLSESGSATPAQQFPGFSALYTGRADIRAVLNAIESLTQVRVVSSPKLMVVNNREAQLQIGDQVPVAVQSAVSTSGGTAPIVNTVQLRDTGVILRVTPRANRSGRVMLEVQQEVSDVVPTTTSGIDSPTIQQRKMSSIVSVADGETIALGGMIRESRSSGGSGLPYLRRIPLLGQLFGSTSKNTLRTELIVLLTPKVIRSQQESEETMEELREQFRRLRRLLPAASAAPEEKAGAGPATPSR